jgi:predicted membrane metal-binding protein
MWAFFGAAVDFLHALAMAAWALGLPLLFLHRWPRATRAFAVYAIAFVLLNQLSMWTLRECFLTTVARYFWEHAPDGTGSVSREWFTVRVARAVFGLTPSHRLVKRVSEALIFATAIGVLASAWRMRRRPLKVAGQAQRG